MLPPRIVVGYTLDPLAQRCYYGNPTVREWLTETTVPEGGLMSVSSIAKDHVGAAVAEAAAARLSAGDCLHALLVTVVEALKTERGVEDTRGALEFQINNLDERDYEFMRP
jgi:hypothetical protein